MWSGLVEFGAVTSRCIFCFVELRCIFCLVFSYPVLLAKYTHLRRCTVCSLSGNPSWGLLFVPLSVWFSGLLFSVNCYLSMSILAILVG